MSRVCVSIPSFSSCGNLEDTEAEATGNLESSILLNLMFKISVEGNCLKGIWFPLFTCKIKDETRLDGFPEGTESKQGSLLNKPLAIFCFWTPTPWRCLGPNGAFGKVLFSPPHRGGQLWETRQGWGREGGWGRLTEMQKKRKAFSFGLTASMAFCLEIQLETEK